MAKKNLKLNDLPEAVRRSSNPKILLACFMEDHGAEKVVEKWLKSRLQYHKHLLDGLTRHYPSADEQRVEKVLAALLSGAKAAGYSSQEASEFVLNLIYGKSGWARSIVLNHVSELPANKRLLESAEWAILLETWCQLETDRTAIPDSIILERELNQAAKLSQ